ncbi:MAG: hypothetical protein J6B39_05595 [Lachnospiraceae bacterium]|nr:hypothetical protein [Lachnospiraceae bacterium]
MKVIDVYKQYFNAECVYNGIERKGAVVTLTATSDSGMIKYEVGITFFPYRDPEDFAISYDAYVSKELYNAKGRRSKKREQVFLEEFKKHADSLAESVSGKILWDKPIREACYS